MLQKTEGNELKNKFYVIEITLNSDLPTYLMEKVPLADVICCEL